MRYEDITEKIIGAAYQVYNFLGFGFLESVYEKSMVIELQKSNLNVVEQEPIQVFYEDELVGDFIADLIVEDEIIVELKSVTTLHMKHEVQLVNYLTATKTDVGLLINFGEDGVEVKRKVRKLQKGQDLQDKQD